ncbi:MAG TPA: TetR/AcrR family transcriptional regulator, partial [Terriglobales bacterium]|nr:TetR/AcrR family transcriptional regulator [Terriglobales bacterium]
TMRAAAAGGRSGTRGEPEVTRRAILDAAQREFGERGLAGARTEAIARAAGVNKALLYYYFGDKEKLYGAVLDHVFHELSRMICGVLDQPLPPRHKLMAYAGAHFDFMARSPLLPQLVHREMMQWGRHASPHVRRIAAEYLRPIFLRIGAMLREGVLSGDFRPVDPRQFTISMVGMIVHYFTAAPIAEAITGEDPFTPKRLAERRTAVMDVIAAALFSSTGQEANAAHGRRFEFKASASEKANHKGQQPTRRTQSK